MGNLSASKTSCGVRAKWCGLPILMISHQLMFACLSSLILHPRNREIHPFSFELPLIIMYGVLMYKKTQLFGGKVACVSVAKWSRVK